MEAGITREAALKLLKTYNQEPFHLRHALTVEAVMDWFALRLDPENREFWSLTGLLHDIDFERWPEEHCKKAPELLAEGGCTDALIHAVCSHGWGICADVEPTLEMEKLLFAADELTGLIGAAALMRPTGLEGMEVKSVMKKFKDKKFAAGCSREVISRGAELCGMELAELIDVTLRAMQA